MVRFLSEKDNTKVISEILSSSGPLRCAVAFWGEGAWKFFKRSDRKVEIICNLESGATNPALIKKLRSEKNIKIKTIPNLHAKVYITDSQAIVGSSNVSANGLSLEDKEINGWIEASIITDDKNVIKSINDWFEEKWGTANEITDEVLEKSKKKWDYRRNVRSNYGSSKNDKSLFEELERNPHRFKDRNIYFAIYRHYATKNAKAKFSQMKENMQSNNKLDFYEDWSDLPDNSYLIDIYYGLRRKCFEFKGIFQTPVKPIIEKFENDEGGEGEIIICFPSDSVLGYEITKDDQKLLEKKKSELWEHSHGDNGGRIISLYDAKSLLF